MKTMTKNKIVWLTGPSGCGKTTIAQKVKNFIGCVMLDGDQMRKSISKEEGFSREDRHKHNLRVARLAKELSKQCPIIVSVIAPIEETRNEIDKICSPLWVRVVRPVPEREGHFYEEPKDAFFIDNEEDGAFEDCALKVIELFKRKEKHSMFIGRWQCIPPHPGHLALFDTVRREGKKILIAIRDTEQDKNNPYTLEERIKSIREAVPDAKITTIPDIEEICYGRKVGYGIREIELDGEIEAISATELRKNGNG